MVTFDILLPFTEQKIVLVCQILYTHEGFSTNSVTGLHTLAGRELTFTATICKVSSKPEVHHNDKP